MLKKRIIPLITTKNGKLVKSSNFDNFRSVGNIISSSKVYNSQTADELIIIDISKDDDYDFKQFYNQICEVSKEIFMPLSVGGGIRNIEHVRKLISIGADKIIINSGYFDNTELAKEISLEFGKQAVILSIDVIYKDNDWHVYTDRGRSFVGPLSEILYKINNKYIGEIFLQSIDRDGCMSGFDIGLYKYAEEIYDGSIIACGGCGNYSHMLDIFKHTNINALACGSIFNFTDSNLLRAKSYLKNNNINVKRV